MKQQLDFEPFLSFSLEDWQQRILRDLKGKALDALHVSIAPGLEVPAFYHSEENYPIGYSTDPDFRVLPWLPDQVVQHPAAREHLEAYQADGFFVEQQGLSSTTSLPDLATFLNTKASVVDGRAWLNQGWAPVDELALLFAQVLESGKEELVLGVSIGERWFVEIAKLLALQALTEEKGITLHLMAFSGLRNKTLRSVHVNILRNTTEMMVAFLGGARGMVVLPHLALDTKASQKEWLKASRLAINIKHLLKKEARFMEVRNALEGSGVVYTLSEQMAKAAWKKTQSILDAGGLESYKASEKYTSDLEVNRIFLRALYGKEGAFTLVGALDYVPEDEPEVQQLDVPEFLALAAGPDWFRLESLVDGG